MQFQMKPVDEYRLVLYDLKMQGEKKKIEFQFVSYFEWNSIEIDLNEKITYALSLPSGTIQYATDGTPNINVDSQHNADGA